MNKNILEMIEYPKEGILSKDLIKTNKQNISLFCMSSNSEMSEHTSSRKAIVYILEGSGIFNLAGKKIKMKQGVLIFMKKNQKHSLIASKKTSFLLILT